MKSVLILNGYTRNSLAITRSLGKLNFKIDLFSKREYSKQEDRFNRKFASKFVRDVVLFEKEKKLETLLHTLRIGNYDYLFAGGTADSLYISKNKKILEQYVKVVSEDYDKMLRVHDKTNSNSELKSIGIPVPETFEVKSLESLKTDLPPFDPPYILKFSDSYASKGLEVYEGDKMDLYSYFLTNYDEKNLPIIQQKVDGELLDSTCFAVRGEPVGILCQKRVLTAWIKGGGGIINRTISNSVITHYTATILEHFKWNGHLEIDWIVNEKNGSLYFLEMNPKYWGTTQLTIDAGFNFPWWSTKLMDGEDINQEDGYRVGLTYRWVDDELATLIWNKYGLLKGLELWGLFFLRFFDPRIRTNFYLFSDPLPFLGLLIKMKNRIIKNNKMRLVRLLKRDNV
jgi:predicted ATP-grasp superfamily ATP-dependent carboligase